MASSAFKRLVRFVPKSAPSSILIGEPVQASLDVGLASREGKDIAVNVFSGRSVLSPGSRTDRTESVERLLSPLAQEEVGTIRCIGLNYVQHAKEVKMDIPTIPTLFLKPNTSLGDPWPAPTLLPRITQNDGSGDFESELAVVIGKAAKNVSEEDAMDYVLGFTAANDVSSRVSQLNQSQWCFSKGFDGACPIGPTLVSTSEIPDPSKLHIRGLKNGKVMQDCSLEYVPPFPPLPRAYYLTLASDLIFSVPKLVSFLSQGTTLPAGTVIITGTPAGVGMGRNPKETLSHGDEFRVEILPHIGTLVNTFENE
ncbi:bifunctional 4-hydroxyphenylacetate degradation enzyme [Fusarium tjaetaba]|uniref:Bifunctional 4-hydroxyphenylacetate degradation enzyme n=1 Tax=Fusarium tjaetaba TaxID=1567544 RepID=A0A8H5R6G4_9HYPO|nr:bifunctional 4-hydroxyphenylacetate degradation enzyme [Fusarium tjaetaba]KAF5627233.1 bifunctional 4-hydroxyphenylacetate degradation enzyme [Fusarium tjaetaba]